MAAAADQVEMAGVFAAVKVVLKLIKAAAAQWPVDHQAS
jgi:hypothetical protein